jgi:hypothetical protein
VKALLAACFHAGFLLFNLEDGGDMFLRNIGVISQKIVLFVTTTAVRTSNAT